MSELIKVQNIYGHPLRTTAIEFTGSDDNIEEIEKWSDQRLAVKGIKLWPIDREVEVVMAEQYLRFPVGTFFVEYGGLFIPMSKTIFEKRFVIVKTFIPESLK